jgi:hypothetical protein
MSTTVVNACVRPAVDRYIVSSRTVLSSSACMGGC